MTDNRGSNVSEVQWKTQLRENVHKSSEKSLAARALENVRKEEQLLRERRQKQKLGRSREGKDVGFKPSAQGHAAPLESPDSITSPLPPPPITITEKSIGENSANMGNLGKEMNAAIGLNNKVPELGKPSSLRGARISNLCDEDKEKVGKLIQQLLKISRENENMQEEHKKETDKSQQTIKNLREENAKLSFQIKEIRGKFARSLQMIRTYQQRLEEIENDSQWKSTSEEESQFRKLQDEVTRLQELIVQHTKQQEQRDNEDNQINSRKERAEIGLDEESGKPKLLPVLEKELESAKEDLRNEISMLERNKDDIGCQVRIRSKRHVVKEIEDLMFNIKHQIQISDPSGTDSNPNQKTTLDDLANSIPEAAQPLPQSRASLQRLLEIQESSWGVKGNGGGTTTLSHLRESRLSEDDSEYSMDSDGQNESFLNDLSRKQNRNDRLKKGKYGINRMREVDGILINTSEEAEDLEGSFESQHQTKGNGTDNELESFLNHQRENLEKSKKKRDGKKKKRSKSKSKPTQRRKPKTGSFGERKQMNNSTSSKSKRHQSNIEIFEENTLPSIDFDADFYNPQTFEESQFEMSLFDIVDELEKQDM